ncbi:MAG: immunoglobulin-like domain-containing protein [Bacteroidia bacterium]
MKPFLQTKFFRGFTMLVISAMVLMAGDAMAQINYARTATASHSGGGAGGYGPSAYNDGVIPSGTGTPWGWVSGNSASGTSMWVMYEWKSAVSINEWYFYAVDPNTRAMSAGELQYWDGSAWKTATKFTITPSSEYYVEFPTVSTTKMRLTNMTITGNQASNPNWREIECYYNSYGPNDIGIASIDSPFAFCAGTKDIWITVSNYGINQVDTFTINWELDGSAQTPIQINGTATIDTAGSKAGNTYKMKLGTSAFNSTGKSLKVWTSKPNNVADTVNANDTFSTIIKSSLAGSFTIGGTNGDYSDVAAAAADLNAFGVCGPVEFTIRPGTYNGQVALNQIVGASATNTIKFKSAHVDSVTIQHTGTTLAASMNTIAMDGTDWVTFENCRIEADGSYGFAVHMTKEADHNKFSGCVIQANPSVTSTYSNPLVMSGSPTYYYTAGNNGNYNVFEDNDFIGGYFSIVCYGGGSTSPTVGNEFYRNTHDQMYYYGGYIYYQDSLVFHDNEVKNFRNTYNYGMLFYYPSNFDIRRNYITSYYYSYLYYANYYNWNSTSQSTFANNTVISTGTSYNLYAYRMNRTNFFHNSMYGKGSYLVYMPYGVENDMRNNIFYYEGSTYVLYLYNNTFKNWDYNDYYMNSGGSAAYVSGSVYGSISALAGYSAAYNQNNWDLDPAWVTKDEDLHITKSFPNMFGPYVGIDLDGDKDDRCKLISTIGNDELTQSALPPSANFLLPDTAWLGAPTVILNAAKPSVTEGSEWWVNGKMVSDSIHLEYTPTNTGMDTITLVYFNCSGSDTLTKYVYVSPILRAPKVDFSASSRDIYTNETITLFDLSENGTTQWSWDVTPKWVFSSFLLIRDRTFYMDSTEANPKVTFVYPGTYAIKLRVANSFGADSLVRTQYITVREAAVMCDVINTSSADFGTVFDDGGKDGGYSPGLTGLNRCTYSIETCKGEIDFEVDVFDLAEGDYLKIYDGTNADGKPLWDAATFPDGMNGKKSDNSVKLTFTATTGHAYFDFETDNDGQTTGKGFAINWNVNPMTFTSPSADFDLPDTACVGFATYFENTTTGVYSDVEWDVNADGSVEGLDDKFGYTFTSTGTYDVQLNANSYCAPRDSVVKQIVIIDAAKAPTPDFTSTVTKASVGDTVSFMDMSQYCSNFTEWEISPANYIFANNTNSASEMIDVVFTRGGYYTIELTKGNTFGKDSIVKTNYIQILDYCTPAVANLNSDLGITRVEFNDIDNSSQAGRNGYSNYLNISTTVERGLSYPLSVERGTTNNEMTRKVWIDWNIDGDFDDAGEMVASEATGTSQVFNDTITIPASAEAGKTRMRISTNYKNLPNLACGPHQFGEFEDYTIVISDEDNTPPTLTLTVATTDTIDVFTSWVEPGYTAIDLLDGDITGDVVVNSTLDTAKVGTYTVTYTVSDDANNIATDSRTIVVVDREKPTLALNGMDTVVIDVNTSYNEMGTTSSDNYDASLTVNAAGNVDTSVIGEYIVEYCVTDANGNGPVCVTRWVFVQDTVAPVLALVGSETIDVEQCSQYADAGYTVTDNDAAYITTGGTYTGSTETRGTYTITYTATDNVPNTSSVTRTINIVDTKAPTVSLNGSMTDTVERWSDYTDAGYVAADYCNPESEVSVEVVDKVNTQSVGVYSITYQAEDASGNKSSLVTRHVVVVMPVGFGEYEYTDGFELFPNPTSGRTVIATDLDAEKVGNIVVYNLNGQEVFRMNQVTFGASTNVELNLGNLAPGTYHVQISGSDVYTIKKLVISK